jgi:hypothetical protein
MKLLKVSKNGLATFLLRRVAVVLIIGICIQSLSIAGNSYFEDLYKHKYQTITREDVPPDELGGVIEKLRSMATSSTRPQSILIRLEDDEFIKSQVNQFEESEGRRRGGLTKARAPWVIPEVAKFLYIDDSPDAMRLPSGVDFYDEYSLSMTTAGLIKGILRDSPDIPERVKQWASKPPYLKDGTKFRDQLRAWWKLNKQIIEERRYDDIIIPDEASIRELAATAANEPPSFAQSQNPTEELEDQVTENIGMNWLLIAAGVVIFAAIGVMGLKFLGKS